MENKDSLEKLFIRHAETDYEDISDRDPSDGKVSNNAWILTATQASHYAE